MFLGLVDAHTSIANFLRKLYTSAQECPRSYDKLCFDPSKPNCRLVVSHDDYSLISKLPKDRISVVAIFRKLVDRVFSTYEFSVEVAARFLVHPNLTSAKQMPSRIRPKSHGVSTLDIWPWKYLVPWMREDLFDRRDARKLGKLRRINEITYPYNMEEMVMPLHDFINDPVAHEIVHNGVTFQVAGLTNNSYFSKAPEVRQCVRKHPTLGRAVLEVAKSRLDRMLYVGLTEDYKKSARLFVNMVGAQVLSQSEALSSSDVETEALARTGPYWASSGWPPRVGLLLLGLSGWASAGWAADPILTHFPTLLCSPVLIHCSTLLYCRPSEFPSLCPLLLGALIR